MDRNEHMGESLQSSCDRTDANKERLYLWFAYPEDLLTEAVTQRCALLLSEDERARWQRFRLDRNRHEYLITRALVRTALSQYHPLAPEAWRFQANEYGKPSSDPDCGLRFNLSNSLDLVVCLISKGVEVGVDVEPYERAEQIAELAPKVFSQSELAQLAALSNRDGLDRALSLWTLKEAYIKATGMGLSLSMNKFSFLFGGAEGIRLELDLHSCHEPGRNWRFCLLDHAGHRIALMAEMATAPELQQWEARPFLTPPTRLADYEVQWFSASWQDRAQE
jgi:4'-phosphopantetheinyl transferase